MGRVFLPGLCGTVGGAQTPNLWQITANVALPWPLRGDSEYLPSILERPEEIAEFEEAKKLEEYLKAHKGDAGEHAGMEDRRLMYVAMTRARNLLAVSAFRWKSTAKTPQPVQPFWMELLWTLAEATGGTPRTRWSSPGPPRSWSAWAWSSSWPTPRMTARRSRSIT